MWSGDIIIEDVKVKAGLLTEQGLPFKVTSSRVGKLHVQVPWKSIGSSSTVVQLDDLQVTI